MQLTALLILKLILTPLIAELTPMTNASLLAVVRIRTYVQYNPACGYASAHILSPNQIRR